MSAGRAITRDAFLDGRLTLAQPAEGYRAGLDPMLLAAAVSLDGGAACEMGCGAGAALLAAAHANPAAHFTGVEKDPAACELARENARANGLDGRVDILESDALSLSQREAFDTVFTNPPFYDDPVAQRPPSPGKRGAFLTDSTLEAWIGAGLALLRPKGALLLIHRAERLGDILSALDGRAGDIRVKPVAPRPGQPARRVIVAARRSMRGPLRLLPPLALHPEGQASDYTPEAEALLRGRARLEL